MTPAASMMGRLQTVAGRRLRVKPLVACLVLPLAIADIGFPSAAIAATLQVTNCNDTGSGSLRDTVASAQSGDTVDLRSLACNHISLTSGGLAIAVDDLVLQGPGSSRLTIDSEGSKPFHAVIQHDGVGALRVDSLRITDGGAGIVSSGTLSLNESVVTGCANAGISSHGLFMQSSTVSNNGYTGVNAGPGEVMITGSTISGNNGGYCGGVSIYPATSNSTVRIENTTISGNTAGYAGCIRGASVTIANSTVAFNLSNGGGLGGVGALVIRAPQLNFESTIIANNSAADLVVVAGTVIGGHNNLMTGGARLWDTYAKVPLPTDTLTADPMLQPLGDNGGPTMTHALRAGSPAIDAGNNIAGLATDQRGSPFARIVGAAADIGSFEFRPPTVDIDGSFTGSWFDPAQSGHGLMLEVLPDHRLLALWFAFNPEGTEQSWFGGVGTYGGDTAVITDVALPVGGRWLPYFDPSKIVREPWGTLTFTFTDHDHGRVSFDSVPGLGYGSGSMNLLRLTNVAEKNPALATPIGSPGAVTTDATGNVYFSSDPSLVFKLDNQGKLTRIAGSGTVGYSGDGGPATQAQLNFPLSYPELVGDPVNFAPLVGGLAADHAGNVYIADAYNNRVRRIDTNGIIGTVIGSGTAANAGDGGLATNAAIHWPQGVAVDATGNLYVSTVYASLRKVATDGRISALAGDNCGPGYLGPGLCAPEQIAIDAANNIFVPDGYCRVREVRRDGSIFTVAGADRVPSNGSAFTCGYSGDGGLATKAAMSSPYAVAVDNTGNFYIADTGNNCIRKVNSSGIITTVAGVCNPSSSKAGYSGDGGPATAARLNGPHGVAVDNEGNILTADTYNHRIRKISTADIITTIAGNGAAPPAQTGESGWVPTGNLITPRAEHTATLLQNGKVLVVGGNVYVFDYNRAELYDPATHTWTQTPPLKYRRAGHTATLLPDGRVLVAGGAQGEAGTETSAELYDPVSGTWSDTGSSILGLYGHTATLLPNGKVLVAGGLFYGGEQSGTTTSAELYDPATGKWSLTGSLNESRWGSTATLLQDGRVLIAAGRQVIDDENWPVIGSAELYDPTTGKWSVTGYLKAYRYEHRATLLRNGKVLVRGGSGYSVDIAELYDPRTGTWSFTGPGIATPMSTHRDKRSGTLTLLPDGKVLAVGGYVSIDLPDTDFLGFSMDSAELFDPDRGTWTGTRNPNVDHSGHTATLLPNGEVLIAAGYGSNYYNPDALSIAELYVPSAPLVSIDPSFTGSWFDPTQSGHGLMLEVLPDNRLLALWFAFSPEGQQSWFGGVGTYSGNSATISDVALPTGGRWIPNFDPNAIVREPWGTLKFTFTDCNHGLVELNSTVPGYFGDNMNLLRLTLPEGQSCP